MSTNYNMQTGRWGRCYWCGTIHRVDTEQATSRYTNGYIIWERSENHYCGAPWQVRATDIPTEWVPGDIPFILEKYPESPFAKTLSSDISLEWDDYPVNNIYSWSIL